MLSIKLSQTVRRSPTEGCVDIDCVAVNSVRYIFFFCFHKLSFNYSFVTFILYKGKGNFPNELFKKFILAKQYPLRVCEYSVNYHNSNTNHDKGTSNDRRKNKSAAQNNANPCHDFTIE